MTRQGHTLYWGRAPCLPRPARGLIDYIPAKAAVSFPLRGAVFVSLRTRFSERKGGTKYVRK